MIALLSHCSYLEKLALKKLIKLLKQAISLSAFAKSLNPKILTV